MLSSKNGPVHQQGIVKPERDLIGIAVDSDGMIKTRRKGESVDRYRNTCHQILNPESGVLVKEMYFMHQLVFTQEIIRHKLF